VEVGNGLGHIVLVMTKLGLCRKIICMVRIIGRTLPIIILLVLTGMSLRDVGTIVGVPQMATLTSITSILLFNACGVASLVMLRMILKKLPEMQLNIFAPRAMQETRFSVIEIQMRLIVLATNSMLGLGLVLLAQALWERI
jgi:hypothetical protein